MPKFLCGSSPVPKFVYPIWSGFENCNWTCLGMQVKNTAQLLNMTYANMTLSEIFELKHKVEDQDVIQFKEVWNFAQNLVQILV